MRRIFISVPLICCVILMPATLACRASVPQKSETQHPVPVREEDKSVLANLRSPYEIEKYINEHNDDADLREIWETFGIVRDALEPVKCGCRGNDCPGICNAETIKILSIASNEGYVLLGIGYWGETHRGFLLFKKENGWKYLGLAESVAMRYGPSQYKIVKHEDAQWLVIKELWGTGTGFLQYGERWYTLSDTGVKEVLSYPVSGHSVQGIAQDYLFKSKVIHRGKQEAFTVDVLYTEFGNAKYKNDMQWMTFKLNWRSSDKYRVHFIWDAATEKFVFDETKSVLPKSDGDPIVRSLFLKSVEQ